MFQNKWIFVRHRDRTTWEIPGGHIEEGELPDEAAERELKEETGAAVFNLMAVCNYSVENATGINYGRLYFAQVESFVEFMSYEMEERIFSTEMPLQLTYQEIQPVLLAKVKHELARNLTSLKPNIIDGYPIR